MYFNSNPNNNNMLFNKLIEFKNYQPTLTKSVLINGSKYPISIQGNGKTTVLGVGIASLMQRTLSPGFKESVTFYSAIYIG